MRTVLDLFSAAAGGWSLGMHRAGFTTIAACEAVDWRRTLYAQNNPGIPIYDDVCTLTAERLVRDLGRLPDIVVGSPPCQDISSAGAGAGIDGERSGLWREVVRIAGEIRPRFLYLENSPLLVGRGLARVLGDIAGLGMHARWGTLGADDVGAPHIRKRMWVVAYADEDGRERADLPLQPGRQDQGCAVAGWGCEVAADACGHRLEGAIHLGDGEEAYGDGAGCAHKRSGSGFRGDAEDYRPKDE